MKKLMSSCLLKITPICCRKDNFVRLTSRARSNFCHESLSRFGRDDSPLFKPSRAVILSRITRYEFETRRFRGLTSADLRIKLEEKKSDYQTLFERHTTHYSCVEQIKENLKAQGIETKVVNRPEFTNEILEWADVVFTAGGDGTFLDAASKITTTGKPVIGINTDPTRLYIKDDYRKSEGRLCLNKEEYPAVKFDLALKRLLAGDFKWKWRQRIRITMSGDHANDDPIELSDQQLKYLEHRYSEHVADNEMLSRPLHVKGVHGVRILPVRALNEVFFGECLSSRVSYYELSIDDHPVAKQKSSGVTVCTGTGSTSWSFHINRIPTDSVAAILKIANKLGNVSFPIDDKEFIKTVTEQFNDSLIYDPSHPCMGYTVRDPIENGVFCVPQPRGHAKHISIKSRMWDASLVVDGGSSFRFNDGAIATLEMYDEDALRTVDFS